MGGKAQHRHNGKNNSLAEKKILASQNNDRFVTTSTKPKTINRYIGQNPNEHRMGGRIKQESDALWYDDVVNPERGRRKLKKSVFDEKVKKLKDEGKNFSNWRRRIYRWKLYSEPDEFRPSQGR